MAREAVAALCLSAPHCSAGKLECCTSVDEAGSVSKRRPQTNRLRTDERWEAPAGLRASASDKPQDHSPRRCPRIVFERCEDPCIASNGVFSKMHMFVGAELDTTNDNGVASEWQLQQSLPRRGGCRQERSCLVHACHTAVLSICLYVCEAFPTRNSWAKLCFIY